MSDVVAVALLGLGGTFAGAFVTWRTANRNAEVEVAKVRAESKRQLDHYREEERRKLQDTYLGLLAALNRLEWWSRDPQGLGKQYQPIVTEIEHFGWGCSVSGNEAVREAIRPVLDLLADEEAEGARDGDDGAMRSTATRCSRPSSASWRPCELDVTLPANGPI